MFRKALVLLAPLAAAGALALGGTAHAVPTTVTGSTHVSERPDSGNGGTWAYDTFNRSLTVSVAAVQNSADTAHGLVDYTATVTDKGFFSAVQGAGTPNQFVPGTKVLHHVIGSMSGGASYTVTAPTGDTLTGIIPANEDDHFATPAVTTGDWPKLAFATQANVTVSMNNDWSWTYKTACETWVDSAANGDGNQVADGNITGALCLPTTPFVYHGHVLTGDQHNATVGWLDGIPDNAAAWGSGMVNGHINHCVEVFVYGFDRPAGTAHVGFTCDNGNPAANVGYLRGLAPGHTYALFVQPATGTYGNNHPIPGTNPQAHITVVTPA